MRGERKVICKREMKRGENRTEVIANLERQDKEVTRSKTKSEYIKELREVIGAGKGIYEKREINLSRNGLEIVGKFRMGKETRPSEYWKKEEEKTCRLCEKKKESMKYVLKKCEITANGEGNWTKYLKVDTTSIEQLN